MQEPRWMAVVIHQRQGGGEWAGVTSLPYARVEAEPSAIEPERVGRSVARQLTERLRSTFPTRRRPERALR